MRVDESIDRMTASGSSLCPVAAECGGCPLIREDGVRQRAIKSERVRAALCAESIEWTESFPWFDLATPLTAYRNRIRLRIFEAGRPGFFNPEKSSRCAVLSPPLAAWVERFLTGQVGASDVLRSFSHLELRAPDRSGRAGLFLARSHPSPWTRSDLPELDRFDHFVRSHPDLLIAAEDLTPEEAWPVSVFESVGGTWVHVPVGGFVQVNDMVNRGLVETVLSQVFDAGGRSVTDLFCGSGNFLVPLVAQGVEGTGVEVDPRATRALRGALAAQGLSARVENETAQAFLSTAVHRKLPPTDWVLVDPPRAGLGASVHDLARWAPARIAYSSCNPKSLARDLGVLTAAGYRLDGARLFDMFPHTEHVETLVWLSRCRP